MLFYNPVDLRDYQQSLADDTRTAYAGGHRSPMIRLDTGGGKTRIFTHIAYGAAAKRKNVLVMAHRRELIEQISLSFSSFNLEHRIIAPPPIIRAIQYTQFKKFGRHFIDSNAKTSVASVQTLAKNIHTVNPDLIIVDESHHAIVGSLYGNVISAFPRARLLLVTATPCRLDGTGLGVNFGGFADLLLHGPSMRWLIENGYLSDFEVFVPPVDARQDFKKQYGDFKKSDVDAEYSKPKVVGCAIEHYLKIANGLPCVTFCPSVKAAEFYADEYRKHGINAVSVDGTMDGIERSRRINGLADGSVSVLTSADLIGEGLDIPGIVVAQFLRPTMSISLMRQQAGRAFRKIAGKDKAILLDHVGNLDRLGWPDDDMEWSLEGVKKREQTNEKTISFRTCGKCFAQYRPAPACPNCGDITNVTPRKIETESGTLVNINKEQREQIKLQEQKQKKQEQRKCQTLDELIELGIQRQYKFPRQWAEKIWHLKKTYRTN